MTSTVEIVNGQPVADVRALDGPAALARKRDVEARLSALRDDAARQGKRGGPFVVCAGDTCESSGYASNP